MGFNYPQTQTYTHTSPHKVSIDSPVTSVIETNRQPQMANGIGPQSSVTVNITHTYTQAQTHTLSGKTCSKPECDNGRELLICIRSDERCDSQQQQKKKKRRRRRRKSSDLQTHSAQLQPVPSGTQNQKQPVRETDLPPLWEF